MKLRSLINEDNNNDSISIQQEADAYEVAQIIKNTLKDLGIRLTNWKATWHPAGFNIEAIKTYTGNDMQVRKALENIKVPPGSAPIQLSQYNTMKNTYNIVAILDELREKLKPMGLTFKAVTHKNDYPILSFFELPPEEPEPEIDTDLEDLGLDLEEPLGEPGEEELDLGEPGEEELDLGEPGEEEEPFEDIPVEKVDWDSIGI